MPCCGKKRAAEKLARGESRQSVTVSPAISALVSATARPAIPSHSKPTLRAMPKVSAPISPSPTAPVPGPSHPPVVLQTTDSEHPSDVEFEYTGTGRLTVTGPVTGTIYYFSVINTTLSVDGADAPSLVSIPGLRVNY